MRLDEIDPTAFTRPIKNWLSRKADAALAGFTGSAQALARHSVRLVADKLYSKWQYYLGITQEEATMDNLEQFIRDELDHPELLEPFKGMSRGRRASIMTRDEQDQVMVALARNMLKTRQATVQTPESPPVDNSHVQQLIHAYLNAKQQAYQARMATIGLSGDAYSRHDAQAWGMQSNADRLRKQAIRVIDGLPPHQRASALRVLDS